MHIKQQPMNEYSDNHSLYIVVARVLNQINIGFSPSEMTALAPKPITESGGDPCVLINHQMCPSSPLWEINSRFGFGVNQKARVLYIRPTPYHISNENLKMEQ